MKTGEKIREVRKKAKLTQKALGEMCRMPDSQIGLYESGRALPKTATLDRIAHALNVSTYSLMGEDYSMQTPRGEVNGDELGEGLSEVSLRLSRAFANATDIRRKIRLLLLQNNDDLILPFREEEAKQLTRILSVLVGLNADGLTAVEKIVEGLKDTEAFNNHRTARVDDISGMLDNTAALSPLSWYKKESSENEAEEAQISAQEASGTGQDQAVPMASQVASEDEQTEQEGSKTGSDSPEPQQ